MGIFFISSAVSYAFYSVFYFFGPVIWGARAALPLSTFTPWTRWLFDTKPDGVEAFVLYPMVLLMVISACGAYVFVMRVQASFARGVLWAAATAGALFYYKTIGFFPPMAGEVRMDMAGAGLMAFAVVLSVLMDRVSGKSRFLNMAALFLLFLVCMIPSRWVFTTGQDYLWIFTPALRALHGIPWQDSYFQYDYLYSLLAMAWMKLKLPLGFFYMAGNFAFVVLIAGIYWFSRRHFLHKGFAAYLAVALTLFKIYGNEAEPMVFFQASPLRIDWWFLIIVLGAWKGFRHWTVGAGLGFLVLYHHTLGTVYSVSYGLFIGALFVVDRIGRKRPLLEDCGRYVFDYGANLLILAVSFLVYQVFLSPHGEAGALLYQKYSVGFFPVERQSFYWYVPVVLSCTALYLWNNRKGLTEKYFQTTLLLILFAVGNSLYFFGRSHENNIINISAVLMIVFFGLLDLVHHDLKKVSSFRAIRFLVPLLAVIFVAGMAYVYSGKALNRISAQVLNVARGFVVNAADPVIDVKAITDVTGGSPKVTIMSIVNDFQYYYALGVVPQNYFCFTNSWLIKTEYIDFLNAQLSSGYFLVMPERELPAFLEVLRELVPHEAVRSGGYIFLKTRN